MGKHFAGQDLTALTDPNGRNISTIIQEHYNPIILKIRNLNKPVIAVVNGLTQVQELVFLCCDIIVASENIIFTSI